MTGNSQTSVLSPRAREIVAVARELVQTEGLDALSMRRLADRLGIRAPSIYKHFSDKQALENAVISVVLDEQGARFAAAVAGADDPVRALVGVYREFARGQPHLYRLVTERLVDRAGLAPGVEERSRRPIVDAVGGDVHLARAFWAFAHGMTILELDQRFAPDADLEAAWSRGLNAFRAAL
jgi:AcrR family transcriptional regulator